MITIAIVDDNAQAAEAVRYAVEDAGFTPWIFPGKGRSVGWAVNKIKENAQAAICDHRLSALGFAAFNGAELAARLISDNIPAVLISQFVNQDYDVSIRRWRAKVPSLLSRDECRAETIKDALELCRREISGEIVAGRRKHRTLVRVADKQEEAGEQVIDAILPAWNRQRAVRFPATLVPKRLHGLLKKGAYLIAYVNLAATRPEDLFFEGFEKPRPLDERGT
jgi:CheY-like chemotaxis protein